MDFAYSERCQQLRERLLDFMERHIYPNERAFNETVARNGQAGNRWQPVDLIEDLKPLAREAGLWNLFLPDSAMGAGLTNLEYAPLQVERPLGKLESHVSPLVSLMATATFRQAKRCFSSV